MKRAAQSRAILNMSDAELAAKAAEFDKEFVADSFASPTGQAEARWRRAKRQRGRPRKGKGVKAISVSLEKGLLRKSDQLAKKMRVSRSGLIARGLRAVLAAERAKR